MVHNTLMNSKDRSIIRNLLPALLMSAALLSVGISAPSVQAQENAENQEAAPKLVPGSAAPQFKLQDQSQKERSLQEELAKSEWTALLFYRSADW